MTRKGNEEQEFSEWAEWMAEGIKDYKAEYGETMEDQALQRVRHEKQR